MRLNAAASSSNSSPVRITARCSTSPSRTALATSRRCVTGFTITYRTTAHSENIERKPTTMAAVHKMARFLATASTVSWSSIVTRTTAIKSPSFKFVIRRRSHAACGSSRTRHWRYIGW